MDSVRVAGRKKNSPTRFHRSQDKSIHEVHYLHLYFTFTLKHIMAQKIDTTTGASQNQLFVASPPATGTYVSFMFRGYSTHIYLTLVHLAQPENNTLFKKKIPGMVYLLTKPKPSLQGSKILQAFALEIGHLHQGVASEFIEFRHTAIF